MYQSLNHMATKKRSNVTNVRIFSKIIHMELNPA